MTADSRAWTTAWQIARIATAIALVSATAAQFSRTVGNALTKTEAHASHLPTVISNFFSYFTIESNLSSAILLVVAAIWTWTRGRDGRREPAGLSLLLACVSTYMIVTGVVYNILLRGIEDPTTSVAWANEVLHVVGPLFLLADVLVAPRRGALPWRALAVVIAFPVVWAVYTLIRANAITGPATGNPWWYPYPFLDPHLQGGYGGVALNIVGIAAAMGVIGAAVIGVGRWRAARTATERMAAGRLPEERTPIA